MNLRNSGRSDAFAARSAVSAKTRLLALPVAAALLLSACGGPTDDPNEVTTLTVAPPSSIEVPDPHGALALNTNVRTYFVALYDTLVVMKSGMAEPALAEAWDNPDDFTWEFTLREDATWHDGSPVTAADVVSSYNRVIAQSSTLAPSFARVESFTAVDDTLLEIKTKTPDGVLLANLSLLRILPTAAATDPNFFDAPIGSGPFSFESFVADEELVLNANKSYWGGAPQFDRLVFVDRPEAAGRVTALELGEIDLTWGISPDMLRSVTDLDDVMTEMVGGLTYFTIWLQNEREPFNDPRVRQALWHAVDFSTIIKDLFGDTGSPATSHLPSQTFGYSAQKPYSYDPGLAEDLLAEAGFPDGFSTTIKYRGTGPNEGLLADVLISYWTKIGVEVELIRQEQALWNEDLVALDWDMNLFSSSVGTSDADNVLARIFSCGGNRVGYCSEEVDALVSQAAATVDQEERADLYAQAQKILWEDAASIMALEIADTYAFRSAVEGFEAPPLPVPDFRSVKITR